MILERWRLYVFATLITTAILTSWPVPQWIAPWQPQWVPMLLIFWVIMRPGKAGFTMAWLFAILSDLLAGNWLGIHAVSYCVIVFLCTLFQRLFRYSNPLQQIVPVAFLLVLHLGYLQLLSIFLSGVNPGLDHWSSLVTSLLLWPIFYLLLYILLRERPAEVPAE